MMLDLGSEGEFAIPRGEAIQEKPRDLEGLACWEQQGMC